MGRTRAIPRRPRWRWAAIPVLLALLATAPVRVVQAQEEAAAPKLPVLLLNGAVYTQEFNAGDLPYKFRVGGYPPQATALYVVQCKGPIKEVWLEDLRRIGGEPHGYLPYNTLLVGMDGGVLSRLQELDFVAWHDVYHPYFKISPALQLRLSQGGEAVVLAQLFSPLLLQETLDALADLPVEFMGSQGDAWGAVIALRTSMEDLAAVAALPAVEWMELCASGSLPADRAGAAGAIACSGAYGQAAGVEAETVAVMDTGIGSGGIQGVPAPLAGHVSSLVSLRGDEGADATGHGTVVLGSLLGAAPGGAPPSSRMTVAAYATGYGTGCPPQPLSLYSVLDEAFRRGARVFLSGSVPEGRESLGAYGMYSFQRDAFLWSNASMAVVEAAGNEGTDADGDGSVDAGSLLGGAAAKNVLSVGGCESSSQPQGSGAPLDYEQLESMFPGAFPAAPLRQDESVGLPTGMAAFSSRGPARDGRIKPDLVAPATAIPTLTPPGAAVAGTVPNGDAGYSLAYGTSLAAAQAASALASMRLPLAGVLGVEPSSALLKAFLVNGAEELSPGQYGKEDAEIPPAPNGVEGWGKLDLGAFRQTGSWVKVLDDREGMRLGESRVFRVEVASGKSLRVTLAWTDYPSLPQARIHLVNDLDMRVLDPEGNVYYPNGRNSRDPLNNVERVVLEISGRPGDYTIELEAWNVPFSPQPFALVAQVY